MERYSTENIDHVMRHFDEKFKTGGMFTLHNLLWQLLINKVHIDKEVVFHCNVEPEGNEIVITLRTGGYIHTGVMFESNNYNDCCTVCDGLNIDVFNLDVDDANLIVSNSMGLSI